MTLAPRPKAAAYFAATFIATLRLQRNAANRVPLRRAGLRQGTTCVTRLLSRAPPMAESVPPLHAHAHDTRGGFARCLRATDVGYRMCSNRRDRSWHSRCSWARWMRILTFLDFTEQARPQEDEYEGGYV